LLFHISFWIVEWSSGRDTEPAWLQVFILTQVTRQYCFLKLLNCVFNALLDVVVDQVSFYWFCLGRVQIEVEVQVEIKVINDDVLIFWTALFIFNWGLIVKLVFLRW